MTTSDVQRALDLCAVLCPGTESMDYGTIHGAPPSKSRPRFGPNGHAYTSKESRIAERATAMQLRQIFNEPRTGNLAIGAVFFRPNRQRIDVDNMLKHLLDAAKGILWIDDSQVTAVLGIVELDSDSPRTLVMLGEHISTLDRSPVADGVCIQCGITFRRTSSTVKQKLCSDECRRLNHSRIAEPIPCKGCGNPFRRATSAQIYCSRGCIIKKGILKPRISNLPNCVECGKRLSRKGYVRCRDCWKIDHKDSYVREGGEAMTSIPQ
jgi:Holliday junction resolvase RusA-like endonuclease